MCYVWSNAKACNSGTKIIKHKREEEKRMKKRMLAILLTAMMILGLTSCGKKKIDVTETISLNFSGVNGYGIAEVENAYAWEEEAFREAGITNIDSMGALEDAFIIESSVTYNLSSKENLSNGDVVTVTAVCDNEAVEQYNLEFTAKEKTFIVEGLPEIKEIDLFDNIDVTFSGTAPCAQATIVNANTDQYVYTRYVLDKNMNLDIGDIVTVTAEYDKEELIEAGYQAKSDKKEYVVGNVSKYVTNLSEISDETNQILQKQTEDIIKANIAENDGYEIDTMSFLGNYFLNAKIKNEWDKNNCVFYVYKVNVVGKEDISYYYYVGYYNILLTENGACVYDFEDNVKTTEILKFGWQVFIQGYDDMDDLFNECVTKNLEKFEYESTVSEE